MKTNEFKQFCQTLTGNSNAINACVECCNQLELEMGFNIDDIFITPAKAKQTFETASKKGIRYLKSLEFYFDFSCPHSQCKVPLFHGTRRYALEISKEERECFFSACNQILVFAKKWMYSEKIDWNKVEEYNRTNKLFMSPSVVGQYGSSLYQYGDFYLTSSYTSAISFSHNGAGELGEYAYSQCEGFRDLDIELDEEMMSAMKIVENGYTKYKNSEKIILVFYGVKFDDLASENGRPYSSVMKKMESEKEFISYIDHFLYETAKDTDNRQSNRNFRLLKLNHYLPLELGEDKFRNGFKIFTKIQDVDQYIKNHNLISTSKWDFR